MQPQKQKQFTKKQYDIIIECLKRYRNDSNTTLTACVSAQYFIEFPDIIDSKKKKIQELNELIILLTMLRNSDNNDKEGR